MSLLKFALGDVSEVMVKFMLTSRTLQLSAFLKEKMAVKVSS